MKALAVALLVACGPGVAAEDPKEFATTTLSGSLGDPAALAKLMRGPFINAGVWFTEAECAIQFAMPAELGPDRSDAFAHCLAGLHLELSPRKEPLPDVVVLRYAPGFEIEARVLDMDDGPRLVWIGYESRRDNVRGLPTIASEVLESLRDAGAPGGPLTPEAEAEIERDRVPKYPLEAWLEVCLDANGEVTGAHPREGTTLHTARVFAEAAKAWRFRPFVVEGQGLPVCSYVRMLTPRDAGDGRNALPMPTAEGYREVLIPGEVLSKTRLAGNKLIAPDDRAKTAIKRAGVRQLVGVFQLCLAETGKVDHVMTVRTTGVRSYDEAIIHAMSRWVYRPYIDDGHAVPVCSSVQFVYTQY